MARLATLTKGQWDQFDRLLGSTDLQAEEVDLLLKYNKPKEILDRMIAELRRHTALGIVPADGWAAEYQRFYREVFGRVYYFLDAALSTEQSGFGWAGFFPQDLTCNQVWQKCGELFVCKSFIGNDLDAAVPANDRTPAETYAKRFRDRVEADEENKGLSANELTARNVPYITLRERLVLEAWFFWKTGRHLDIENITLCAGSRDSDGGVLGVCWGGDVLYVGDYGPDSSGGNIRARSAV